MAKFASSKASDGPFSISSGTTDGDPVKIDVSTLSMFKKVIPGAADTDVDQPLVPLKIPVRPQEGDLPPGLGSPPGLNNPNARSLSVEEQLKQLKHKKHKGKPQSVEEETYNQQLLAAQLQHYESAAFGHGGMWMPQYGWWPMPGHPTDPMEHWASTWMNGSFLPTQQIYDPQEQEPLDLAEPLPMTLPSCQEDLGGTSTVEGSLSSQDSVPSERISSSDDESVDISEMPYSDAHMADLKAASEELLSILQLREPPSPPPGLPAPPPGLEGCSASMMFSCLPVDIEPPPGLQLCTRSEECWSTWLVDDSASSKGEVAVAHGLIPVEAVKDSVSAELEIHSVEEAAGCEEEIQVPMPSVHQDVQPGAESAEEMELERHAEPEAEPQAEVEEKPEQNAEASVSQASAPVASVAQQELTVAKVQDTQPQAVVSPASRTTSSTPTSKSTVKSPAGRGKKSREAGRNRSNAGSQQPTVAAVSVSTSVETVGLKVTETLAPKQVDTRITKVSAVDAKTKGGVQRWSLVTTTLFAFCVLPMLAVIDVVLPRWVRNDVGRVGMPASGQNYAWTALPAAAPDARDQRISSVMQSLEIESARAMAIGAEIMKKARSTKKEQPKTQFYRHVPATGPQGECSAQEQQQQQPGWATMQHGFRQQLTQEQAWAMVVSHQEALRQAR